MGKSWKDGKNRDRWDKYERPGGKKSKGKNARKFNDYQESTEKFDPRDFQNKDSYEQW